MKRLSFISYTIFLILVLYCSYYFIDPNLGYLQWFYLHFKFQSQVEKVVILFLIQIIFFSFYILFLWLYKKKKLKSKDGVVLISITVLCLLFAYPAVYSYDIFNYLATAKVAFFYRENPYVIMPIEFSGEPFLAFMHAPNKVALYGPGWIILTLLPLLVGGGNFILTLFTFKALVVSFYLLLLYMLYKISRSLYPVLFFGLNPLVVIETLWSGHNDIVMMALLMTGYYMYLNKRKIIGFIFFFFSVFIKYATLILLPVLLVLKYRNLRRSINQKLLFRWTMYGMIAIFFLSTLREEIYPWYAIWFLPFVALAGKKNEKMLAIVFSFCLELRYFPYMIFLTHFGLTPIIKIFITFVPVTLLILYLYFKKLWPRIR